MLTSYLRGYIVKTSGRQKGAETMEYDDKVKNRLKRIEGQVKGILKMMDENKDCKDVITQLSAARSAIDRSIGVIVSSNLIECIQEMEDVDPRAQEDIVRQAVDLLVKSR